MIAQIDLHLEADPGNVPTQLWRIWYNRVIGSANNFIQSSCHQIRFKWKKSVWNVQRITTFGVFFFSWTGSNGAIAYPVSFSRNIPGGCFRLLKIKYRAPKVIPNCNLSSFYLSLLGLFAFSTPFFLLFHSDDKWHVVLSNINIKLVYIYMIWWSQWHNRSIWAVIYYRWCRSFFATTH